MNSQGVYSQQCDRDARGSAAQAAAAQAFDWLVGLAETRDSDQPKRVARFVGSTYDGEAFLVDLCMLSTFDIDIGDDMLICIDALRWRQAPRETSSPTPQARRSARPTGHPHPHSRIASSKMPAPIDASAPASSCASSTTSSVSRRSARRSEARSHAGLSKIRARRARTNKPSLVERPRR